MPKGIGYQNHKRIKSKVASDSVHMSSKGNIPMRNMEKVHVSSKTASGMKMSK